MLAIGGSAVSGNKDLPPRLPVHRLCQYGGLQQRYDHITAGAGGQMVYLAVIRTKDNSMWTSQDRCGGANLMAVR